MTLTLSEDVLRRARHLAVEKGVSLSKLPSDALEEVVLRNDRYDEARAALNSPSAAASRSGTR